MTSSKYDLDTVLMQFYDPQTQSYSDWTARMAVEGLQVFGGIGSGKTSGSGKKIMLKFLANGFGGLVLTAKPGEKEMWEECCRKTNRLHDLVVIEPGGKHAFNFMEYESSNSDTQIPLTANLVQVLRTVIKASEDKSKSSKEDSFWETGLDMILSNIIDLCLLAYGKVTVSDMYDIFLSAPKPQTTTGKEKESSNKAFRKAYGIVTKNLKEKVKRWEAGLEEAQKNRFKENDGLYLKMIEELFPEARTLRFIDQFFAETFRDLSSKTRSILDFIYSGFLYRLLQDPVYSLFSKNPSTVLPEDSTKGKIILINLPVKIYNKVGRDCQILMKYIWQRAMEKRNLAESDIPVFLWADEAQNFLHEYDSEYQATARSSRISTVYLTQNLPNYNANMGGDQSADRVKSFCSTMCTKIFHANTDMDTNRYASDLIGEAWTEDTGININLGENPNVGNSKKYTLRKMVRPEEFVTLKTGGVPNSFLVESYVHIQGSPFHNGFNHIKVTFKQNS